LNEFALGFPERDRPAKTAVPVLRAALRVVQDAGSLMGFSVLALRLPRCCKTDRDRTSNIRWSRCCRCRNLEIWLRENRHGA